MNDIIYISCQYDEETYQRVFSLEEKPMQAASKYHRLLCEGLSANKANVTAYSILPVNRINCRKKIIKEKPVLKNEVLLKYPVIINFPIIKHILLFLQSFLKILFAPKNSVIFYDCLVIAASYGACLAGVIRRFKRIAIVTDLPEFMQISRSDLGKRINDFLLSLGSGFLLLTNQMNEKVNRKGKPYLVLEGHVDYRMEEVEHAEFDKVEKRVIYAGGLQIEYGIKNLCRAFLEVAKDGEVLHVYGEGAYKEELKELCCNNKMIVYHGNVPNTEVVLAESAATLLVNPRAAEAEFTKYSFPSKTMEYMVSGTPVVMTKLPGMPEEYCSYVYLFKSCSIADIKDKLRDILDKSSEELCSFGARARRFVLDNKNNQQQAKKVLDFVKSMN